MASGLRRSHSEDARSSGISKGMIEPPETDSTVGEIDAEIEHLVALALADPSDAKEIEGQIDSLIDLKLAMIDREAGTSATLSTKLAAVTHRGEHRSRRSAIDAFDGGRAALARASRMSRGSWRRNRWAPEARGARGDTGRIFSINACEARPRLPLLAQHGSLNRSGGSYA